jgi:CRISPR-associated protein Csx10
LLSPLCAGSGLARPAGADRDVLFDECGLPWISSRRLKGLWKDAYRDLREGLGPLADELAGPDGLFGKLGDKNRGALVVGNARLKHYDNIRPWFAAFVAGTRGQDRRASVMDAFSSLRRQTAMDRCTGAPKDETLRSTRVVNPGLVFEAPVSGNLSDCEKWTLALAAAALREMGTSRWRGLGRVKCSVLVDGSNRTAVALNALTSAKFEPGEWSPPVSVGNESPLPIPNPRDGVVRFSLETNELAVFPEFGGDPNTVRSASYVPGTAIHGWFACKFLASLEGQQSNDRFREIFTSGRVRFSNAHFAEPAPHSLRVSKANSFHVFDLARNPDVADVRRGREWVDANGFSTGRVIWVEPEKELHYHHARAKDGRLQRAIGAAQAGAFGLATEDAGAFFQYECLTSGQTFHGEIRGDPEDLIDLARLVSPGERLELGRSKSAQYGAQAVWRWKDSQAASPQGVEQDAGELTIVALAPVLARNDEGHPTPCFPVAELEAQLGVQLERVAEFCRTQWQGGYLSHLRLPKSQQPAWSTGSVLVLKVKDGGRVNAESIRLANLRAYGRRVELGFGKVSIAAGQGAAAREHLRRDDPPREAKLVEAADTVTAQWVQGIFNAQVLRAAKRTAKEIAKLDADPAGIKSSLLHRLLQMMETQTEEDFRLSLKGLRKPARSQLERCQIKSEAGEVSLLDYLLQDWRETGQTITTEVWRLEPAWKNVFRQVPAGRPETAKAFYLELLAAIAREVRAKTESDEE